MTIEEELKVQFGLRYDHKFYPLELPDTDRALLAQWFCQWGFRTGAEIGVQAGIYSECLMKANPESKLYCIDAWTETSGRGWNKQKEINHFKQQATQRLSGYPCTIIQKWSVEAAQDFKDESLDFVYIDADHSLTSVMADLNAWVPKVRIGGVISGHDYIHRNPPSTHAVIYALKSYTKQHGIKPWFVLGSKTALPGHRRDKERSWMWVKR